MLVGWFSINVSVFEGVFLTWPTFIHGHLGLVKNPKFLCVNIVSKNIVVSNEIMVVNNMIVELALPICEGS